MASQLLQSARQFLIHERQHAIRHTQAVLIPHALILGSAALIIALLAMYGEKQEVDEVKVWETTRSKAARQAITQREQQIARIVHVPRHAPEATGEEAATTYGDGGLAPDGGVGVCFEAVLLRVRAAEDGEAHREDGQDCYQLWVGQGPGVGEKEEILDGESEGDEDVVAPDEHEAEMFGDDIPRVHHLTLVDEVVPNIPGCESLVQEHAAGDCAESLVLLREEAEVDEEPACHARAVGEELDVDAEEARVQLCAHDEVLCGGAVCEPVFAAAQAAGGEEVDTEGEGEGVGGEEELGVVSGDPRRGDVAVPDGGQGADDDDSDEEEAVALVVEAHRLSDARRTAAQGRAGRRLAGKDGACDGEEDDVGEDYKEVVEGRQGKVDGGEEGAHVGEEKGCGEGEEGEIANKPVHGEESFEAVSGKVAQACQRTAGSKESQ